MRRYVWQIVPKFPNEKIEMQVMDVLKEKRFIQFFERKALNTIGNEENDGGLMRTLFLLSMKNKGEREKSCRELRKVLSRIILEHEKVTLQDLLHSKPSNENIQDLIDLLEENENVLEEQNKQIPLNLVSLKGFGMVSAEKIRCILSSINKHRKINKIEIGNATKLSKEDIDNILYPLPELKGLCLGYFVRKSLSFLSSGKKIESLELSNVPHVEEKELVDNLLSLKKLKELSFRECSCLKPSFFSAIEEGKFEQLESLSITDSPFLDDKCLRQIVSLFPKLKMFDVSGCKKLTSQGFSSIAELEYLETLKGANCSGLTEKTKLDEMKALKVVDLSNTSVSNSLLFTLSDCKLVQLNLENTQVTEKGVISIFYQEWQRVEKLLLRGCKLAGKATIDIFEKATNLKQLSLSFLSKDCFEQINTTLLESLVVDNVKLSKRRATKFFAQMKRLQVLEIYNSNFEGDHLQTVSCCCPLIKSLSLRSTKQCSLAPLHSLKNLKHFALIFMNSTVEEIDEMFSNSEFPLESFHIGLNHHFFSFDVFSNLCKSSGFFIKKLHLPSHNRATTKKDASFTFPNLEEIKWTSNEGNLHFLLPLSKLRTIKFGNSIVTNYDLGTIKDHPGVENFEAEAFATLFLEGSYFLKYMSEGKIANSLKKLCVQPAESLTEDTIEYISNLTSLVTLKIDLSNSKNLNSEEVAKKLCSRLPLLDEFSLFKVNNPKKEEKVEKREVESILESGERRFALVTKCGEDVQYHVVERLIHSNYFVFALYNKKICEMDLEKLSAKYGEERVELMETDEDNEEKLLEVRKVVESKTDHLDLIVIDKPTMPGIESAIGEMKREYFVSLNEKVWTRKNIVLHFGSLVSNTLEKKKQRGMILCCTQKAGLITENLSGRLHSMRVALASLHQVFFFNSCLTLEI